MSWPRPLFYGLFMLPLHMKITVWPVVVAQALITATVLRAVLRRFVPGLPEFALVLVTLVLTLCTSLPWFVSQLMPDMFGGLMVLSLALLAPPRRLGPAAAAVTVLFAAACVTMHLAFLPISLAVAVTVLLCRALLGAFRWRDLVLAACVPVIAAAVVTGANAKLTGNVSPSPYGKIFMLTRVLMDGPGQRALERECPRADWTLCAFKDQLPDNVDDVLFGDNSVVTRAGGYKVVAPQALPIILSAVRTEPGAILADAVRNTLAQFVAFRSGDALIVRMASADGEWRADLPPAEVGRYHASKQYRLMPLLPEKLQMVHVAVGGLALVGLLIGGVLALRRREEPGALYAAIAVALLANAFVSGALSGVFDRYQSRFVWLAPFAVIVMGLSAWARRQSRCNVGQALRHPEHANTG